MDAQRSVNQIEMGLRHVYKISYCNLAMKYIYAEFIRILFISMIIIYYFADAPLQTAGPSLKPNTRHAVCHFPTILYVMIISKLLLLLFLLFTIYHDL